jgi:hypothetical protein
MQWFTTSMVVKSMNLNYKKRFVRLSLDQLASESPMPVIFRRFNELLTLSLPRIRESNSTL